MRQLVVGIALLAAMLSARANCWDQAATIYGLPKALLGAIADVESDRRPDAMNYGHLDRTHSYDIGLMQINSRWLKRLAKFGITEEGLRKDPCQNLLVGAWILASNVTTHGASWDAVGAYNAGCPQGADERCQRLRSAYTWKVFRALQRSARTVARVEPEHSGTQQIAGFSGPPRISSVRLSQAAEDEGLGAVVNASRRAEQADADSADNAPTK